MVVTDNPRILRQLRVTGALGVIGSENVYEGNEWVGRTVRVAYEDAWEWVRRDE
jgi:SulP family sulfate permease